MKVLELFCGTKSISNAFQRHGHETYTVDWNAEFEPTLCADVGKLTTEDVINLCGGRPDVIWASPDCTSYSVAAISHHRRKNPITGNLDPITDYARMCDQVNKHVIDLIKELSPKWFFIENPRGGYAKNGFRARDTKIHGHILPIRRNPDETHGHMDEPPFSRI